MSIELNRLIPRKSVVWFEAQPSEAARDIFEAREYLVDSCTSARLADLGFISGLSAVVFTQDANDAKKIAGGLRKHAHRLLDFDCNIILRSASGGMPALLEIINELNIPVGGLPLSAANQLKSLKYQDGIPPTPHAMYFLDKVSWIKIANFVSENPPGPAPNQNVKINVSTGRRSKTVLNASAELLIRRAFWDCAEIHLTPIDKGRSGVDVYRACAELGGGAYGRWPQPRFVKLGDRSKILSEYRNYVEHVEPYIPFHLGPHLVRERCCLGARQGILVGDYVEESEDLCDCAPEGRSAPAIACLFDRTLLGWHRSAWSEDKSIADGFLSRFPRAIDQARMDKAKKLGATLNLKELQRLFRQCISKPILVGPVHGDLHSGNVRVRSTDAIIIDFLQHKNQPLVYDAALLEASLLVEGFENDNRSPHEWLKSFDQIYSASPLTGRCSAMNPNNRSSWFYASVQQIRRYAREWEIGPNQYVGALALALLIKATKDPKAPNAQSYRRAGAYVIAERILITAFGKDQPVPTIS